MVIRTRKPLTAVDLPELMNQPCSRGSYRAPLAQYVMDWNQSEDRVGMLSEPRYEGPDPLIMPAIAVVAHALATREGVSLPSWVRKHRASRDVALFGHNLESRLGKWVRARAPEASRFHRVFFEAAFLDKGTAKQWNPRSF